MVTAESFDVLEAPQFNMRDTFIRVRLPPSKAKSHPWTAIQQPRQQPAPSRQALDLVSA